MVEQRIENPRVGGSTPSLGTTFKLLVVAKLPEATTRNPPSAGFLLSAVFAQALAAKAFRRQGPISFTPLSVAALRHGAERQAPPLPS